MVQMIVCPACGMQTDTTAVHSCPYKPSLQNDMVKALSDRVRMLEAKLDVLLMLQGVRPSVLISGTT